MAGSDAGRSMWRGLLGVIIVGLFAAIFLFYTNSFIMKRRKRGIERIQYTSEWKKRHIAKDASGKVFTAALDRRRAGVRHCIWQTDDDAFVLFTWNRI